MLSQYGETRLMKRLEKFNIAGYLLKDTPTDEIAEAIRTVMTGTKYFGRSLNLSSDPSKVNEFGFFDDKLSTREQEVLECICDELNNQEIANFLEISVHTVETIRFRLMNKTGAKNTAGLVKWAFHQGILGGNPNPPL
jgi:DNA-binding NarL/FixJ family response regulator